MTAPTTPFLDGLKSLNSIMAQAQVFASAWSSVGGPFDNGDMLESAELEKAELREEVAAALLAGLTRAALAAPASQWLPISSAPKGRSMLLFARGCPIYVGQKRRGNLGEPQQNELAWRCDSSGCFSSPTHWMECPGGPAEQGEQG